MKLENVTKKFGDKIVFRNFSLEIENGALISLTGASGSGKTTLLRILAMLDCDFEGVYGDKPKKVSFAFQEPLLFDGANVIENVDITGKKRAESELMLKKLCISEKDFTLYPNSLSGGMAKRVSLARALLYDADLYLIDEPFAGLDDETKKITSAVISQALKGKAAVISTHDIGFANSLDYRIVL